MSESLAKTTLDQHDSSRPNAWTYYLENAYELRSLREGPEKRELMFAFKTELHDLLSDGEDSFNISRVEEMEKLLRCIRHLNDDQYEAYVPVMENFFKGIVDTSIKKWQSLERPDLDDIDVKMRAIYKAQDCFIGDRKFYQHCHRLLLRLVDYMYGALKSDESHGQSYINAKLKGRLPNREAYVGEDYEKEMAASFEIFVQTGLIQVETKDRERNYFFNLDGERWNLKLATGRKAGAQYVALILDSNPDVSYLFEFESSSRLRKDLENSIGESGAERLAFMRDYTKKVKANFESEQKDRESLRAYDLPKDQEVYRLSIFPDDFDRTVVSNLHSAILLNHSLKSAYPKMKVAPLLFDTKPKEAILKRVGEAYLNGVRHFSLDFYDHGELETFSSFGGKSSESDFYGADDLVELFNKFPEAKFQINTIACHGAGLKRGLQNALHLKKVRAENYSTHYHLHFMKAIMEGKSYGEAVEEADNRSKQETYLDAEAIIDGEIIAMHNLPETIG